jgi:hypothetical protein
MEVRTSTMAWSVEVEGMTLGRGNIPDIEVHKSIQDYLINTDRVLITAIDYLNNFDNNNE